KGGSKIRRSISEFLHLGTGSRIRRQSVPLPFKSRGGATSLGTMASVVRQDLLEESRGEDGLENGWEDTWSEIMLDLSWPLCFFLLPLGTVLPGLTTEVQARLDQRESDSNDFLLEPISVAERREAAVLFSKATIMIVVMQMFTHGIQCLRSSRRTKSHFESDKGVINSSPYGNTHRSVHNFRLEMASCQLLHVADCCHWCDKLGDERRAFQEEK
ncbi:hypothetical protein BJV77DRAFT_967989, partial [Russula vinacea]